MKKKEKIHTKMSINISSKSDNLFKSDDTLNVSKCIVSIDVGVKNLAICVLTEIKNKKFTNDFDILFWKLYDVTKMDVENEVSEVKIKKPRKKKGEIVVLPPSGKCQNIIRRTGKECGLNGPLNTRGRAYCGRHNPTKKHNPDDTQQWCYDMIKSLSKISKEIVLILKPFIEKSDTEVQVLIEQQSMDNKKIMLQSHVIYSHFVQVFDNTIPIRFVPAFNKLKVYDGPEISCTLKGQYAVRKFMSKKHTEFYLETEKKLERWKEYYTSCKSKQDDLADSFLQGLYFIKGKGNAKREDEKQLSTGKKRRRRKVRF